MNDGLYIIAFDSTQQALRAEMLLEFADVKIDICPTPKQITAGCSLCIEFEKEQIDMVRYIIEFEKIIFRGVYFLNKEKAELLFK